MRRHSFIALGASALAPFTSVGALGSLALLSGCASRHTADHASHTHRTAPNLTWLEGAWTTQAWGGTLNADYATRPDGLTIGYTHLIKGDASSTPSYHEFELFAHDSKGSYLIPHPAGKPAPRFALAAHDATSATYENAQKDFPTRIVYQRVSNPREGDQLIITLSDPFNNTSEPIVFTFTRRPE